jgi:hypothetical protein
MTSTVYLTAGQIVETAISRREINKLFREQDESDEWPVRGRFNATNRAIRRIQKLQRESGIYLEGLEYALAVEHEISCIVNEAVQK